MNRYITAIVAIVAIFQALWAETWTMHQPFTGVDAMAQTKQRIYMLSSGALYAYDQKNDETLAFNELNYLHDVDITGIFAPMDGSRLAVAYLNGNIDIIADNGTVTNLPDIKDSRVNGKNILHIAFNNAGNRMLAATQFGAVCFNLAKMEVTEALNIGRPVEAVAFNGDNPVIFTQGDLMQLQSGSSFQNFNNWETVATVDVKAIINAGEHICAIVNENNTSVAVRFTATSTIHWQHQPLSAKPATGIATGNAATPVLFTSNNALIAMNNDGTTTSLNLPGELCNRPFTAADGTGDLWFGLPQGIVNVDIAGADTYISDPISPGDMPVKDAYYMRFAPSGNLYIGNRGGSNVFTDHVSGATAQQAMLDQQGKFRNLITEQRTTVTDPLCLREDPDDNTVFYAGDLHNGFFALNNNTGEELVHFTPANSPLTDYWGVRTQDIAFDPRGYMWVLSECEPGTPSLYVLSPEGRKKLDKVEKADWTIIQESAPFYASRDGRLEVSANGRYIYAMGNNDIFVYDTNGTATFDDDQAFHAVNFSMADGTGYASFSRFNHMMEDPATRWLWIATSTGVIYLPEPWNIANGTVQIVKPKVPRNDGTQLADYLLSTQNVYGIAIDASNNKWMATRDSGVFLVSADGTQILLNHNTSNSPLPSNTILSVATNASHDGTIYLGTHFGLVELHSEYAASTPNYKAVKIYPNPVRPDYYGDVTIEGLAPASKVKIVTASGSLVAELESEGGAAHWSARTGSGARMPSGVYYVMASSQKDSGGTVGKIIIVR